MALESTWTAWFSSSRNDADEAATGTPDRALGIDAAALANEVIAGENTDIGDADGAQ